jgi:hypothetical protein
MNRAVALVIIIQLILLASVLARLRGFSDGP